MRIRPLASLSGRATRKQFVFVHLLIFLIANGYFAPGHGRVIVEDLLFPMVVAVLVVLGWFSFATTVRRLHDLDLSGWWYLAAVMPIFGFIPLVVLAFWPAADDNRYGPDPRDERMATGVDAV